MPSKFFQGTFVHTPSLGELNIHNNHLLALDGSGFIEHFDSASSPASRHLLQTNPSITPTIIPDGSFILPTFCDLHLHAPQFLYQGNGLDLPLMQWLGEYALKAEERLDSDPELARRVYSRLASRLIENGTGAVVLFGTIKEETNLILAETMQRARIRAFVGKLSMDISSRPSYIESSTEASLASAVSFVHSCRHLISGMPVSERMVEPILTPRFIPTCSEELLKGLGEFAKNESLRIQSHLAEAHDEVKWVMLERGANDMEIFERNNLLTPLTIQAHCTFLHTVDLAHLSRTQTSIAHCPLSNVYFSTLPFPLREALSKGVKVGLGTDIAGGYSLDIMNAMRQAVCVSRMRENKRTERNSRHKHDHEVDVEENLAIDWKESLYLATRGGALALNISPSLGMFAVGAPFDAQQVQLIDPHGISGTGPLDFFDLESPKVEITSEMIEKWWCIGDTRNRVGMWVQGVTVTR